MNKMGSYFLERLSSAQKISRHS